PRTRPAAREIRIENARSHNLAGVSCRIPLGRLTVVSGPSGSGKSTLAFDTLYAEGQRRYVTSLSTYARQFLERLPRPEVDAISHLPPAIAIEQRNAVTNARSTVGTATEILDHLRLLFARVGETWCCGERVGQNTVTSVGAALGARFAGQRLSLGAPLPAVAAKNAGALRDRLVAEGYGRLLFRDGSVRDADELTVKEFAALRGEALVLVDRLVPEPGADDARLAEAVARGFERGSGLLVAVPARLPAFEVREGFACARCARRYATPEPALFSWNSARGACEACQGWGRMPGLDLDRVVPDPAKTLAGNAIAPFATPSARSCQRDLLRACRAAGLPTDVPWMALSAAQRAFVVEGDGGKWYGVRGFFEWLEGRRYKVQARITIARYRRFDPCPVCEGTRLRADALAVEVGGRSLGAVSRLTLEELVAWASGLALDAAQRERGGRVLDLLLERARTALRVGLGYLGLDRQVRTLSGGEAQRIQLATALGGALTASLYVLDEPSIGLHARDVARLLDVLRGIRDRGNTVVVVEHAPEIVGSADHLIDLGPGAGRRGGRIVVEGSVAEVAAHPTSATGRALRGELGFEPRKRRRARGSLRIVGASERNLKDVTVHVPLGQLVAVTGVSGAGKSTLVRSVLVGGLRGDPERGACTRIEGGGAVREVVLVEPTPPGRSLRSNPATVSKAFEGIRRRFAATREARALGVGPGWFSFNVAGGRCEQCEGTGETVIDMQFLEDVRVPCEACSGTRYREEARRIRLDGHSIVEILEWTLEDAAERFAGDRSIAARLEPFRRVGLGYLTLAQPLSTLSGGELQRMRLALALAEGEKGALYVLDEPTTGLHPAEVEALVRTLDALLESAAGVIVVEHNLELIRQADHVIDLGPEGGPAGGSIVAEGTPEDIAACADSHTGAALRGEPGGQAAR
ncbi:MAG TPA: excinuclease ABC subunit UvrA, partial [Myxococcota bacterium]|nr:excinuclease ABC subunit UvrA [Myxococcota bacterium]